MIVYKHIEYMGWDDEIFNKYKTLVQAFSLEVSQYYDAQFSAMTLYQNVVNEMDKDNRAINHTVTFFMDDDKAIGYVAWFVSREIYESNAEFVISHCFILPEYRGKGIYGKFINDIPDICESLYLEKPKYISAGISITNMLSGEVHKKLGFKPKWVYCAKELKDEETDKS